MAQSIRDNIVRVELGERSYDIVIRNGSLHGLGEALGGFSFSSKAAIVSNPTVFDLYGETVLQSLRQSGFEVVCALMKDGEAFKNLETCCDLWDGLLAERLDRRSPLIALGGGVVGDVAGFIAATYMRGIPYVQVPTTLLAQVDSSVGGKTGIDHAEGKNLIGCFYQPSLVWIDTATLKTLDERQLRCGLAEIVKYGMIRDAGLFADLEEESESLLRLAPEVWGRVIGRCCELKAEVVAQDEREGGLRAILNFGHTIGHAVEASAGYRDVSHGEGVAIGMVAETRLAVGRGMAEETVFNQLEALLKQIGLPTEIPADASPKRLIRLMTVDKKAQEGAIRVVLPTSIGRVDLPQPVSPEEIEGVLEPQSDKPGKTGK